MVETIWSQDRTPTLVELKGVNGRWMTISGEGSEDSGCYLATGVKGIYDAPVKTIRNSTARQTGSSYGGKRNLERLVDFGVIIDNSNGSSWQENDSEWRKMWSYDEDCELWVDNGDSRRCLKLRMIEQPDFEPDYDPKQTQIEKVLMKCVAGDPFWYEPDIETQWQSTIDTIGGSTETGFVTVSNPTDVPIWLRWKLQGASTGVTWAPRWTLPDYSWLNDDFKRALVDANKMILTPSLFAADGHGRIETNPESRRERMATTKNTQWQARFGGVDFLYPVPPYTKPTNLPVRVTGAPAGVAVQCIQPRPWSRVWGLQ